jgi:hypothetical protein
MELGSTDKIALIVDTCHKCADVLKDPTLGGTIELHADKRKSARDDAYDELTTCIDVLAAAVEYHNGFFDVINIANKYKTSSDVSTK